MKSEDDATNILDLPTDPVGGGSNANANVRIRVQEDPRQPMQQPPAPSYAPQPGQPAPSQPTQLNESTIHQLVSGLQEAMSTGYTQLPSRDIPTTTTGRTLDAQSVPTYLPPQIRPRDYVAEAAEAARYAASCSSSSSTEQTLDALYCETQLPILAAVLYFLFQLPAVNRYLYHHVPGLFSSDGSYNLTGYLFASAAFGAVVHAIVKFLALVAAQPR